MKKEKKPFKTTSSKDFTPSIADENFLKAMKKVLAANKVLKVNPYTMSSLSLLLTGAKNRLSQVSAKTRGIPDEHLRLFARLFDFEYAIFYAENPDFKYNPVTFAEKQPSIALGNKIELDSTDKSGLLEKKGKSIKQMLNDAPDDLDERLKKSFQSLNLDELFALSTELKEELEKTKIKLLKAEAKNIELTKHLKSDNE